ncbi:MAG: hypothetical protein NTZ05_05925, partial [Chloroflexi bacterium]|nr:hypothetical protein [Chloroflexota bacterium]
MRDGQWRLAVAAVETAFLVALALGVALRMAGQGAPTVENALVAGAVVMAAVALARFIWLAPLPDTAARRAAPRTLLGMPIRTAAYAAGPGAELGGGLLVLAALLSAASGLAALSAAAIPAPLAQWAGWTGRLVFLFAA